MNKATALSQVFMVYGFGLLVFAGIYYSIYRKRPNAFVFATNITVTQRRTARSINRFQKRRLRLRLDGLNEAFASLGTSLRDCKTGDLGCIVETDTHQFVVSQQMAAHPDAGVVEWVELQLTKKDGVGMDIPKRMRRLGMRDLPVDADGVALIVESLILQTKTELQALEEESKELAARNPQQIWTYFDFLYFSTITQGTVGYGDILPNSTIVRMFVMAQTVLTALLLVVVLNLVASP